MPYIKHKGKTIIFPYTQNGIKQAEAFKKTRRGRYIPDKYFNDKQLLEGIETELEHTANIYKAKQIAKDHLNEDPRYYKYLEKMEKNMKKTRKRKY